jgi:hypothetical protein
MNSLTGVGATTAKEMLNKMASRTILSLIMLLSIPAIGYTEFQLGGDVTLVKFPGEEARDGFGGRVLWFSSNIFGVMGEIQRYDIGDNPDQSYKLFGCGVLGRFYYVPLFAPYVGTGLYVARLSSISDGISSPKHTFNDTTLNIIAGSQFLIGPFSPFIEYQRVFYFDRSEFFGRNRANVFTFGVVVNVSN